MVKGSRKDKETIKKREETQKKNKIDLITKSPILVSSSPTDSLSYVTLSNHKIKTPNIKPRSTKKKSPKIAEHNYNDKKKNLNEKNDSKHNRNALINSTNYNNSEPLSISLLRSPNESYILSPLQYLPEEIESETVRSFSIVPSRKFGSLEKDSPMKVLALRPKAKENKSMECLVQWKLKGKEILHDSIVNASDLRERFPKLLLDFYEERLKFI